MNYQDETETGPCGGTVKEFEDDNNILSKPLQDAPSPQKNKIGSRKVLFHFTQASMSPVCDVCFRMSHFRNDVNKTVSEKGRKDYQGLGIEYFKGRIKELAVFDLNERTEEEPDSTLICEGF